MILVKEASMSLNDAIENVRVIISSSRPSFEQMQQAIVEVLNQAYPLGASAWNQSLQQFSQIMTDSLALDRLTRASMVAFGGGTLVDMGGDPMITFEAIATGLQRSLIGQEPFVVACHEAAQDSANVPDPRADQHASDVMKFGYLLAEKMIEGADAYQAVDLFTPPMLKTLCHSQEARTRIKQNATLTGAVERFQDEFDNLSWLSKLIKVLDNEELIVLHPETRRGYRILIGGIGTNFELHVLLMDALIGNAWQGWIPGKRPAKDAVASIKTVLKDAGRITIQGQFNLVNWMGLQPDNTLGNSFSPESSRYWIWNEGTPADIAQLDGKRIVLLGKPPYNRSWNGGRAFQTMHPLLEVQGKLSPEEYEAWISKIRQAIASKAE